MWTPLEIGWASNSKLEKSYFYRWSGSFMYLYNFCCFLLRYPICPHFLWTTKVNGWWWWLIRAITLIRNIFASSKVSFSCWNINELHVSELWIKKTHLNQQYKAGNSNNEDPRSEGSFLWSANLVFPTLYII